MARGGATEPAALLGLSFGMVIALVIVLVQWHVTIALAGDTDTDADERDRSIRTRAEAIEGIALTFGIVATVFLILFGHRWMHGADDPFVVVNALVGVLVCATLVRYGTEFVLYRLRS